jgi:metal-responsive CopG/Arc/MetJ family transcriptional regulator
VNFSIHLPDPLLADLDAFAQTRPTSRSGVIREANTREFRRASKAWSSRAGSPELHAGQANEIESRL